MWAALNMLATALPEVIAGSSSSLPELPAGAQYGILGVLVAMLGSGWLLVPRYVLDRERERADRMEVENVRLNTLIQEKAIPALVDAANAVKESTLLVHDVKRDRDIQAASDIHRRDGEG